MPSNHPHPAATSHLNLDPSSPGSIVQYIFAFEAILGIGVGAFFILSPSSPLTFQAASQKLITPLSTSLVQMIGGLIAGLSIPMLFAVPNTRRGIELRAPMFCCLGGIEVFLIGFYGYMASGNREAETGFSSKASATLIWNMAAPLALRVYALWAKPQWFGRNKDGHSGKSE
jgi:hypothetical protein